MDEKLLSEDPEDADQAVADLCYDYFGDGHSGFNKASFYAGEDANKKLSPTLDRISSGYRDVVQAMIELIRF